MRYGVLIFFLTFCFATIAFAHIERHAAIRNHTDTAIKNAVKQISSANKQISKRPAGIFRIKQSTRVRIAKIEALSRKIDKIEANINRVEAQIRRAEGRE